MKISKNTIVSLRYKLTDAQNNVIEEPEAPMVYLHGGYDGTFPKIETALDGQDVGYETTLQLDPGDAFGEYDPELLKIEPRTRFPEPLEVGMQFEGVPDADDVSLDAEQVHEVIDDSDEEDLSAMIYTVTDVAENQVVLDGNHPLAGMALRFWLQVEEVRIATDEEIQNRHPQGEEGLGFGVLDEGDDEMDEDYIGGAQKKDGANPHTLH
ncbi:peptidylprolyl isomerase [Polynucleobacter sp. IMCC30063]|uniref:FKBP-type peptidyl-prolyl cis-trans isomerase n=1 Tax=unclassified Polynucleobacter TaxID=2640945 RepID=UPI001F3DE67D|nr:MULTISPECIES: peptidylprolyl isomerase [unclassified Polynucleobacter]MCE7506195.1 peptidylprolyl isomerase [Polynucleobacter sp. IMCC30063]MCE7527360.1 peptidylprolyl isomerase [Polynucleobacter sp. IMCC 30228]